MGGFLYVGDCMVVGSKVGCRVAWHLLLDAMHGHGWILDH